MDYHALAEALLRQARGAGADAADLLIAEGTEFSVTVRKDQVETLKEAGSKALRRRVFVGQRTASSYTSDFSPPALATLVQDTGAMATGPGGDSARGLPEQRGPAPSVELG